MMILSGYRLWLLTSALALMLLVLWSQLYSDVGKFSGRRKYHDHHPNLDGRRRIPSKGLNAPPVLAYWILGSKGEKDRMLRLLRAIYHPRNQYLLQLDSSASDEERVDLALSVQDSDDHDNVMFHEFGNVNVVGRRYAVNRSGASGLAALLHAAALLLRISGDWDWFIPLSTSDYPLSTQDDILYAFSSLPRDVNFVGYANDTGQKMRQNVSEIAVDPSLYLTEETPIFYAEEIIRGEPDAFRIFGGSQWMILSRVFVEHCVEGWDNLPRKLLMYFNNLAFPLQSYFHTILCNTPQFQNTTINDNLRRSNIIQINRNSINASSQGYIEVVASEAIFAGPFNKANDKKLLRYIDACLLHRNITTIGSVVPGKWCRTRSPGVAQMNETTIDHVSSDFSSGGGDEDSSCSSIWGDIDAVEPGPHGVKLQQYLSRMVKEKRINSLCGGLHVMHQHQDGSKK